MSNTEGTRAGSTPWHLWVIGVISLLWGAMGALDYVMTQTRNEAYLSQFTEQQLAFFYGIPSWAVATWAIAVWGGVLGSLLLLIRRRQAVAVFLISMIALFASMFQNYVLSNGMEVMGDPFSLGFTAAIVLFSIALFIYALAMRRRQVLV